MKQSLVASPLVPSSLQPPADGRVLLNAAVLKQLRKQLGLSQEALADLCLAQQLCVSIASIKRAETGKVVLYRTARHLAKVYGVAFSELLNQQAPAEPTTWLLEDPSPAASPMRALRSVLQLQIQLISPVAGDEDMARHVHALALQFGGHVSAVHGDRIVVVFGLQQAHRSDAQRCVRCAIELGQQRLTHRIRSFTIQWSHSRQPSAAPGATALSSDADVLALHQGHVGAFDAPIYVERDIAQSLAAHFSADEPSSLAPPGLLRLDRQRLDADAALPSLIGRMAETRQFESLVEVLHESQSGHVVYLRGMAGVGKSRLLAELTGIARLNQLAVHTAEVLDFGAVTWHAPLGELVSSLMADALRQHGHLPAAIDHTVQALALPGDSALFYSALVGIPMTPVQARLLEAMSHELRVKGMVQALHRLLQRQAAARPLMVCIEDIHWADPTLLQALGALMSLTLDAPIVWVLTSRLEGDPLETLLRPRLVDLALTVFDLGPLRASEAQALADQFNHVDADYRRHCVARAQGNPLFLTQLLASPDRSLPDSLKHLIQTRLDLLSPLHREALTAAAVLGHRVELSMWRQALRAPDYVPDLAWRHCFVRPVDDDHYVFVHDLVLQCIYESVDPAQRRLWHRTVAALYVDRDLALCAHHLCRARDPSALKVLVQAVHQKLNEHQHEAALELATLGQSMDGAAGMAFTLVLLGARAKAGVGQVAQAREDYQRAMQLATTTADRILVVLGLAPLLNLLDLLPEEELLLDQTLPLAQACGDEAALAHLYSLKGNIYFPRGDYGQSRHFHERALGHAQASGQVETKVRALSGIADAYYAQGRMAKAREVFAQCVALCAEHALPHVEASNRSALGSTLIYMGLPGQAEIDALGAAETGRLTGNRRAEMFSRLTAAWVLLGTGQFLRAKDEVLAGLELARSLGAARFEPFFMETMARVSWALGEQGRARQEILWAVDEVERLHLERFIGPWVMGTLAWVSDDAVARQAALQRGEQMLQRGCLSHNAYRFLVSAAEVTLLDGDAPQARRYADQLALHGQASPDSPAEACPWVDHHVALIRHCAGWMHEGDASALGELQRLSRQADQLGYAQVTPRLYAAVAGTNCNAR